MSENNVLVGKTLKGVYLSDSQEAIKFELTEGSPIAATAYGDCCSHTWIESVELPALGFPATVISVDSLELPGSDDNHPDFECLQVYGLKITTDRGEIVIDYRNSSNGYYGGNLGWPGEYGHYSTESCTWKKVGT